MVRILKVREIAARKQQLLKRSELYRQTMGVELANVKYSAAMLQRKFRMAKSGLWLVAAVAGFLLMRRRGRERQPPEAGLFAKVRSGVKFFGLSWPLLKNLFSRTPVGGQNGEAEDTADAF
jgi:hypothetical protein